MFLCYEPGEKMSIDKTMMYSETYKVFKMNTHHVHLR
jgi:hypothetical protein